MEIDNDDVEIIDDSTDDDDRESPPPEAERFVWGFREINALYSEVWLDDPHFELPDGVDAEELEDGDRVAFEKGETIPGRSPRSSGTTGRSGSSPTTPMTRRCRTSARAARPTRPECDPGAPCLLKTSQTTRKH